MWGMDVVRPIYPPSSEGHKFILVAADYFSKWAEAVPLKEVKAENIEDFNYKNKSHISLWLSCQNDIG